MGPDAAMDALLDAVRDHLRSVLSLSEHECDVTPDGQPNPSCGERFVAVHSGDVENTQAHCLDERYSFRVTVTKRLSANPRDRQREGGVWKLALAVRAKLHMSYAVTALALAKNAQVSFTVPPVFTRGSYLGVKGADWFWAEGQDVAGVAVELLFTRAERLTYIDEAEE